MARKYFDTHFPHESQDLNQENLDDFFRFMYERHMIWHKRFIGKLPREQWTNDEILKKTKYTNIYRELDRGTLYYLQYVYHNSYDLKTLLWKTIIYRLCNRIETFEEVPIPDLETYDSTQIHNPFWEQLEKIRVRGEPVMTSAHLTCPSPPGYTKVEGYILAVNDLHKNIDKLHQDIVKCKTSEEVYWELRTIHCVGAFIAYEVLCDLMYNKNIGVYKHSLFYVAEFAPFTENDWANVGPGAKVGIRLIYPSIKGEKNQLKAMRKLLSEQHEHFARLGLQFPWYERFSKGMLSLRSIEHSLCEYSKYWLQKNNLGKQRMIFKQDSNKVVSGKRLIVDPSCGDRLIYQNIQ